LAHVDLHESGLRAALFVSRRQIAQSHRHPCRVFEARRTIERALLEKSYGARNPLLNVGGSPNGSASTARSFSNALNSVAVTQEISA
jgi:hypothetical protein